MSRKAGRLDCGQISEQRETTAADPESHRPQSRGWTASQAPARQRQRPESSRVWGLPVPKARLGSQAPGPTSEQQGGHALPPTTLTGERRDNSRRRQPGEAPAEAESQHWASGRRTPEPEPPLRPREADSREQRAWGVCAEADPQTRWGCRRRGKQRGLAMWPGDVPARPGNAHPQGQSHERQEPPETHQLRDGEIRHMATLHRSHGHGPHGHRFIGRVLKYVVTLHGSRRHSHTGHTGIGSQAEC